VRELMEIRRRKRSIRRSCVLRGKLRKAFFNEMIVSDLTIVSSQGYGPLG
jgi:hypothetical protein